MKVVQKFYPPSTTIVIFLLLQRVENVPETFFREVGVASCQPTEPTTFVK